MLTNYCLFPGVALDHVFSLYLDGHLKGNTVKIYVQ